MWVLSDGSALQEQAARAWAPRKPASALPPLSMGQLVLPRACSSLGSPWGHSLFWVCPSALMCILPGAAGAYLFHHEPPWAAGRGTPCLTMVCRKSQLQWLEHLLPLLLHSAWCLQSCLSHVFSTPFVWLQFASVFPLLAL